MRGRWQFLITIQASSKNRTVKKLYIALLHGSISRIVRVKHRVFVIIAEGLTRTKPTPAQPLAKYVTSAPKLDILPECARQSLPRNQPGANHKRHQGTIDFQLSDHRSLFSY